MSVNARLPGDDRPLHGDRASEFESGRVDDLSRWTYTPAWRHRPAEIVDCAGQLRAAGPWLVLAADRLGEALVDYLRGAGAEVFAAWPGPGFGADGRAEFTIRPDSSADFSRMLGTLPTAPGTVVHMYSVGSTDGFGPGALNRGFHSLLALARALTEHLTERRLDLVTVTEEALSVAGAPPRRPIDAALGGLVPVLAQENLGWQCRHVDVARTGSAPLEALAASIASEALTEHAGPVALRGAGRWLRVYEPHLLHESLPGRAIGAGSTVMVTGGLGHLGLMLARHLTQRHGCRVAIVARTALPEQARWKDFLASADSGDPTAGKVCALTEIVDAGGEVLVVPADVTDEAQMRVAVTATELRFGRIDLIVHAAGFNDEAGFGAAHLIDRRAAEAHIAVKAHGFRVLCDALAGRDIRGLTMSSLSTVLGGLTLAPYAAGNAAMDACVLQERASGRGRWLTVDWDTWRPDHLAREQNAGHTGTFDMAADESLEMFDRAVGAIDELDRLVVSTGPLDARIDRWVAKAGAARPPHTKRGPVSHPRST
jgi:NAD(P)-dependent dehydrogenase (short-subunit alcohol dehydrogenase family)